MIRSGASFVYSIFIVALTLLCFGGCFVRHSSAQSFRSRQLSATEIDATLPKLSPKAIPYLASSYVVDKKQSFALEGEEAVRFDIEPVRYEQYDRETPTTTSYQCGIFVIDARGSAKFLPAFKEDTTDLVQCMRLDAMAFENVSTSVPPRIILIYDVKSPNTVSKGISILAWNAAVGEYKLDPALGLRLEDDLDRYTMAAVKRQLHRYNSH